MSSSLRWLILDCYVDEPACFGVPPFVSPYPRYIYGALVDGGVNPEHIEYLTIDHLRQNDYSVEGDFPRVFLIGGAVVPGKYLGQEIGTTAELEKIVKTNESLSFVSGGPAARLIRAGYSNLYCVSGDIEYYAWQSAVGRADDSCRSYEQLDRWAAAGAAMVKEHPHYPDIICEIESYRGCPRSRHCSFCSEKLYGKTEYREQASILDEVDRLIGEGVFRFRIGRQADILAYKSSQDSFIESFPRPNPPEVISLFRELGNRRREGKISVLNVDNANPGTVAWYEKESYDILSAIADAVSPGDTLPLGIESFDPVVIQKNNLKIDGETFLRVVELMNSAGGARDGGIPKLLPGVNLIHRLPGEDANTFKLNYETLMKVVEKDLLLKRINIRTLVPFDGSRLPDPPGRLTNRYRYYREKIRKEIDHVMLQRIYPAGSVLRDVKWVGSRYDVAFGRQIASYAITVKTRSLVEEGGFSDVVVSNHRERSLEGFVSPLKINTASEKQLSALSGIGVKRARSIVHDRPFLSVDEVSDCLQNVPDAVLKHIEL